MRKLWTGQSFGIWVYFSTNQVFKGSVSQKQHNQLEITDVTSARNLLAKIVKKINNEAVLVVRSSEAENLDDLIGKQHKVTPTLCFVRIRQTEVVECGIHALVGSERSHLSSNNHFNERGVFVSQMTADVTVSKTIRRILCHLMSTP